MKKISSFIHRTWINWFHNGVDHRHIWITDCDLKCECEVALAKSSPWLTSTLAEIFNISSKYLPNEDVFWERVKIVKLRGWPSPDKSALIVHHIGKDNYTFLPRSVLEVVSSEAHGFTAIMRVPVGHDRHHIVVWIHYC